MKLPPAHLPALLATLLMATPACTTKQPPPAKPAIGPLEKVAPSPVGTTQQVLQKTFALKTSAAFPFEIPAHAAQPHLHGNFQSFFGKVSGISDDSANIDFLVLNDEQLADFASGRAGEALFSVAGSHNQEVNLDLPASLDHAVKYTLVFRNAEGSKAGKVVQADFRMDF